MGKQSVQSFVCSLSRLSVLPFWKFSLTFSYLSNLKAVIDFVLEWPHAHFPYKFLSNGRLTQKPREQAVKQELERMEEGIRGVIRLGLDVQRRWPEGVGNEWGEWWAVVKQENAAVIKGVEQEGQVDRT